MILKRVLLSLWFVVMLCTIAIAKTPTSSVDKHSAEFSYGVTPELIKNVKDKITSMALDSKKLSFTLRWIKDEDLVAFANAFPEATKVKIHFANELTSVESLGKLVNITELWLDAKKNLQDLSPLAKLTKLQSLYVFYNAAKQDLTWLAPLTNLKNMNLAGEGITSVDTFPTLPNLTSLHLKVKDVPNVDAIAKGAPKLLYFSPSTGKVGNIDALGTMPELKTVRVFLAEVNDFKGLAKSPKLSKLDLVGVKNADYTSLGAIKQLKILNIDRASALSQIDWVKNLLNLTHFGVGEGNITDFTPLGSLSNLTNVTIASSKKPVDITFVKSLKKLRELRLSNNKHGVTNMAAVSNLPELNGVYLNGSTPALDLTPLTTLPKLKNISVSKKYYTKDKLPNFDKKIKISIY